MEHRREVRGTIHHRRVHHLPLARALAFQERGQDAHDQVERPTAEVGDEVERRNGRRAGSPNRVERSCDGQIVDVVPRGARQRPLLTPPRHAPVDEPRVPLEALLWPEPETLRDPRAEPFDKHIGPLHQLQDRVASRCSLEVERDRASPAVQHLEARFCGKQLGGPVLALDAQHVGAQVGEQHAPHRGRPDARQSPRRARPREAPSRDSPPQPPHEARGPVGEVCERQPAPLRARPEGSRALADDGDLVLVPERDDEELVAQATLQARVGARAAGLVRRAVTLVEQRVELRVPHATAVGPAGGT